MRGIAVLAVMLAHFGHILPGGFLGVDVFFVISGFVITLSLLRAHAQSPAPGALLATFWKRRFFRLVPTLALVVLVTLVAAAFTLPPDLFRDQVDMSLWSLFFAGNIGVEVLTSGEYFDPGVTENWLLHLWSLGVEEQFYLLFPILFLLLASRSALTAGFKRGWALWVIAIGSFGLSLLNDADRLFDFGGFFINTTGISALLGYYSPVTRAWQFLAGVLAALAVTQWKKTGPRWLSLFALAALLLSFFAVSESNLLPGLPTLVPIVAMAAILVAPLPRAVSDSLVGRALAWLGDRSYSAYLWHWPVWLFLTSYVTNQVVVIISAFAVTLALAALSYQFVERRFRESSQGVLGGVAKFSLRKRVGFVAASIAATLTVGLGVNAGHDFMWREGYLREKQPGPRVDEAIDCLRTECDGSYVDVLLIGDSHAGALANELDKELAQRGLSMKSTVMMSGYMGCMHLPSTRITSSKEQCLDISQQVRDTIDSLSPRVVILTGYTVGRFTSINSGEEADFEVMNAASGELLTDETAPEAYRVALDEVVAYSRAAGARTVILSDVPDFQMRPEHAGSSGRAASVVELMFSPWLEWEFGGVISKGEYLERAGVFVDIEQDIATSDAGTYWVDSWPFVCGDHSCQQVADDGRFIYSDHDHVSFYGASLVAGGLVSQLDGLGVLKE
jgi:peptidoglycan/LPS O-acetylase OafA/YrhL